MNKKQIEKLKKIIEEEEKHYDFNDFVCTCRHVFPPSRLPRPAGFHCKRGGEIQRPRRSELILFVYLFMLIGNAQFLEREVVKDSVTVVVQHSEVIGFLDVLHDDVKVLAVLFLCKIN